MAIGGETAHPRLKFQLRRKTMAHMMYGLFERVKREERERNKPPKKRLIRVAISTNRTLNRLLESIASEYELKVTNRTKTSIELILRVKDEEDVKDIETILSRLLYQDLKTVY